MRVKSVLGAVPRDNFGNRSPALKPLHVNSCLVRFEDGYMMVTSRNAPLRRSRALRYFWSG
jgi:hypothetical protein